MKLVKERLIPWRYDGFDDAQLATGRHRAVTVLENRNAALIIPIVEHPFQDAGISSLWHTLKKVPWQEITARGQSLFLDVLSAQS